jgi:hypothetical protein
MCGQKVSASPSCHLSVVVATEKEKTIVCFSVPWHVMQLVTSFMHLFSWLSPLVVPQPTMHTRDMSLSMLQYVVLASPTETKGLD